MTISMLFTVLCYVFQLFLVTANRELMAVMITLCGGEINIALNMDRLLKKSSIREQ